MFIDRSRLSESKLRRSGMIYFALKSFGIFGPLGAKNIALLMELQTLAIASSGIISKAAEITKKGGEMNEAVLVSTQGREKRRLMRRHRLPFPVSIRYRGDQNRARLVS